MDIHPLIAQRASLRGFSDRPVEAAVLRLLFEAARWAPSSFNEQPWRFLVASANEPNWLERLGSYLSSGNAWAKGAPVLIVSAYSNRFARNDRPNPMALRDLGAAEENMFLQAYAIGLAMHQIAGFDRERLKRELLPPSVEPGVMSAIGYPLKIETAREEADREERGSRSRRPLHEFVFGSRWGEAAEFVGE